MPVYEYQCRSCKHEFEARKPIAKRDTAACPRCGGKRARRLVSMFYSQPRDGASAGYCSTCSGGSCDTCKS
jgi:putative FmdB family regulatory protein